MSNKKLIGTEAVRIDGVWRQVYVYANVLQLACRVAPKAARNKSQSTRLAYGAIRVDVGPL